MFISKNVVVTLLTFSQLFSGSLAFVPLSPSSPPLTQPPTQLADTGPMSTGFDPYVRIKNLVSMPSGDVQRKFRRTVYTHDDWVKHRDQSRFLTYLAAVFKSGVYKNLVAEVTAATFIASFICAYNAVFGGYTDFEGIQHGALMTNVALQKLGLPLNAFTTTSPMLGLLLVFRTNSSYRRWDEARKNWGSNINRTRDLVRQANTFYDNTNVSPAQRAEDMEHIALCTWAFVRSMMRHLSPPAEDEADFQNEMYDKLPLNQAEAIIAAAHRPNRALQDLSYAIENLPMHYMRKNLIQEDLTQFEDNLGSSERILTSPVPLFYSRHLARFLTVWLFLLPFALYDTFGNSWNHIMMIPGTTVISTMLFGIEEIGTQLEEPFTVLPMQSFCDKIYNWCMEISRWYPGDNGHLFNPVKAEHAYFTDDGM